MTDPLSASAENCATLDQRQHSAALREPQFWKRYSPHHEFSVSTAASIVCHGLIAALILLVGWKLLSAQPKAPLPFEPIQIVGSGNQRNAGPGHGDLGGSTKEAADGPRDSDPQALPPDGRPEPIKTVDKPTAELPPANSDSNARLIGQGDAVVKDYDRLAAKLRNSLNDSGAKKPGGGGNGDGPGGNQGKIDRRDRILRWRMK